MLTQAGEKQVLQVLPWDGACVCLCTFVSASGCMTAASRRPEGYVGWEYPSESSPRAVVNVCVLKIISIKKLCLWSCISCEGSMADAVIMTGWPNGGISSQVHHV